MTLQRNLWQTNKIFAWFTFVFLVGSSLVSLRGYTDFSYGVNNAVPTVVVVSLILITTFKFPLSRLLYCLLFLFYGLIMMGVYFRYSQNPIGWWLVDVFDLSRNPYDRITHFIDGAVPCLLAREIFVRYFPSKAGSWWPFSFGIFFAMALSCFWEQVEWLMSIWPTFGMPEEQKNLISASQLGMQGNIWDTQWDMFSVTLGALTASIILGKYLDRSALHAQEKHFGKPK